MEKIAGTVGESKRLEAIKIEIEGLEGYCVEYRVYVQGSVGKNGKAMGQ